MLELLQRIFIGHNHKWEIIRNGPLVEDRSAIGYYYDVRCSICGKIKTYNKT